MKKKFFALALTFVMILSLSACGGGSGSAAENKSDTENNVSTQSDGKPVTLQFASIASQGELAYTVTEEIISEIEEKSNGSIKIEYFPDSQLGDWEEVLNNVMLGTVDICYGSVADNIDPRVACGYLMGLASDYDTVEKLFAQGSWLRSLISDIYAEKMNVKYLAPAFCGFNGIGMVKELKNPVDPSKDKGAKVRCSTQTTISVGLSNLGYTTVAMNYGEVFTSLQSGLIDGWLGGGATLNYTKMRDAINYYYDLRIQGEMNMFAMSKKSWDKLSDEQKEIVQTAFNNGEYRMYELVEQYENESMDKLEEDGIKVFKYTKEELAANNEVSRTKTWNELEDTYGEDFMQQLRAEIENIEG